MSCARALLFVLLVSSSAAIASDTFPLELHEHLDTERVPTCLLCHQTLSGGLGTVTKPFGAAIRGEGVEAGDVEAMLAALDALDEAGSDVDDDGTPDVTELRAGTDPNDELDGFQPEYGFVDCAQTQPSFADAALLGILVVAATARRARGRGRR